jgi:hypothetical protein
LELRWRPSCWLWRTRPSNNCHSACKFLMTEFKVYCRVSSFPHTAGGRCCTCDDGAEVRAPARFATVEQFLIRGLDTCPYRKSHPLARDAESGDARAPMLDGFRLIWSLLIGLFRSRAALEAENLVLRQQIVVLRRTAAKRPSFNSLDSLILVSLYRLFSAVRSALTIVRPETVVRWHRAGFRAYWRWKSRPRWGRSKIPLEIRQLAAPVCAENSDSAILVMKAAQNRS